MLLSTVVERSITQLHGDCAARFVLLGGNKALPYWRGWLKCRRPGLRTVLAHVEEHGADRIGIVPWSIGETVFDADAGAGLLPGLLDSPRAILPTRRGEHWYYDDNAGRGNRNGVELAGGEVRGDIRSAKGQCRLHYTGVVLLSDAMRRSGRFPWQDDLFAAVGLPPVRERRPAGAREHRAVEPARRQRLAVPALPIEQIPVGHRCAAHFDEVRRWAYREWRSRPAWQPAIWHQHVQRYALDVAARFPTPWPDREALLQGAAIAAWVYDHQPVGWLPPRLTPDSMRRQRGGLVRARNARAATLERNRAIVATSKTATQHEVARRFGVSQATVSRLVSGRLSDDGTHRIDAVAVAEVEAREIRPLLA